MKTLIINTLLLLVALNVFAQAERRYVNSGNQAYHTKNYDNSMVAYEKALTSKPESFEANFNMAAALYKKGEYEKSIEKLKVLATGEKDKYNLGQIYHNMGNAYAQSNKAKEAIEAYKQALINNPQDEESRFNLGQLKKLQRQQQEQDKKDENKDQDKDQNEDKEKENQDKNKDDEKKDQEQNQDQEKNDEKSDEKTEQQNGTPQKISKEDAERILNNLEEDEKDLIKRLKQEKHQTSKTDKEW